MSQIAGQGATGPLLSGRLRFLALPGKMLITYKFIKL